MREGRTVVWWRRECENTKDLVESKAEIVLTPCSVKIDFSSREECWVADEMMDELMNEDASLVIFPTASGGVTIRR